MICVDSDLIIDFLKGEVGAVKALNNRFEDLVTTEVNVFEIFQGIFNQKEISEREEISASSFFNDIEVFSFESGAGKTAAKIFADLKKSGKIIDQNDCLIASIMLKNGCDAILTGNVKHFRRIKGIKVEEY
jgi:tRNA(fMet)-specific endonuclease VapC